MPESSVHFHKERSRKPTEQHVHYPFWFGGSASCFAACVSHPLDLSEQRGPIAIRKLIRSQLKCVILICSCANSTKLPRQVRLQTQSKDGPRRNMGQMFVHVFKEQGILGLYKGVSGGLIAVVTNTDNFIQLSASILRQLSYSTVRFGVYEALKERISKGGKEELSILTLIGLSSISGFAGGVVGNPADVLNVRMQHDAALPAAERRNYKHAVDGLIRMSREEGIVSLWRGVWPNSARGLLMTAAQLASYDSFKKMLLDTKSLRMKDDLTTHFTASLMAGFVATTICSPVDVVKTRIMSSKQQSNMMKLLGDIYKKEGFTWVFKGWVPSFLRLGPHTIATFLFFEQHKRLYRKFVLKLPEEQ